MAEQKKLQQRVAVAMRQITLMESFLQMKTWTAAMGAQLVSGIYASDGCREIPSCGVGLDGQELRESSKRFRTAHRILKLWNETYDPDDPKQRLDETHPFDFLDWCEACSINTGWYRAFQEMVFEPGPDEIDSLYQIFAELINPTNHSTGTLTKVLSDYLDEEAATKKRPSPVSISTPDIALAFEVLKGPDKKKSAQRKTWTTRLSGKWAKKAMVQQGRRGKGDPTLWNPVELARMVIERYEIDPREFEKVFRSSDALSTWSDEWQKCKGEIEYFIDLGVQNRSTRKNWL